MKTAGSGLRMAAITVTFGAPEAAGDLGGMDIIDSIK